MKVSWSLYYNNNLVCDFFEYNNKREASSLQKIEELSSTLNLPSLLDDIKFWLSGEDLNFKQFKNKYKDFKVSRVIKLKEAIDIDYENIKKDSYYQTLNAQDRLLEIMSLTYETQAEMSRVLGLYNTHISLAYSGRPLCTKLYRLNTILKKIDSNLLYVLCNDERYKYESYINMNLSCYNLYRLYKQSIYQYKMPRSLTVWISKLKRGTLNDIHLSTLYSFSNIYHKPLWWLIQDEAFPMIYPDERNIKYGTHNA